MVQKNTQKTDDTLFLSASIINSEIYKNNRRKTDDTYFLSASIIDSEIYKKIIVEKQQCNKAMLGNA